MVLGSFIFSYEKIPHVQKAQKTQKTKKARKTQKVQKTPKAQKTQKTQKATFFILDVSMRTNITPFVFLFAYLHFVLVMANK